ncbi:hypothetical protein [Serratia marcescens]|uniref:hypothetical protein n=1 Tax=Serratia marcescens TaxID=615 RepID=UPI000B68C80E|nr:hypothetical protein [Serratia marcescens]OUI67465.1 hypothetical protein AZZ99_001732 [Serratia marcescens]
MSDIETIRSVIDLDFVPDECIADSVNMVEMFPQFFVGDSDDYTAGCIPAMSEE